MANKVEAAVERIAEGLIKEQEGMELVDVEYVKEKDWYLRIFVDKEGGIDLDDCQKLSEQLGEILDRETIINGAYILEVSSPGLDRVLKKEKDFIRERGKKVDVSLYAPLNGQKMLTGVLKEHTGNALILEGMEPLEAEKIAQIRLHIDF